MGGESDHPRKQFTAAWQAAVGAVGEWRQQVAAATTEAMGKIDPDVAAPDPVVEALESLDGAGDDGFDGRAGGHAAERDLERDLHGRR